MENDDIVSYIRKFHAAGWMPGSVGAVAQLIIHNENSKKILITPHNLDVNTFTTNDLFVMKDLYGSQEVQAPLKGNFSISKWAPTFFMLLGKTESRCAAFVSNTNSCLAGAKAIQLWKEKGESHPNMLRLSHCGLIGELSTGASEIGVPIIDCTPEDAPNQVNSLFDVHVKQVPAILVRNYGLLAWAGSLGELRNKIEIFDRLFQIQLQSVF